ncbi:uncharacterized protein LOC132259538 [Phlebotomus argentipes]|uniref:uncharacterized protein LOC132259538 n=1 Tax=Phlebotomus argentipes TaxID=94469 RepID=UPI002892998B|nr:uncharacterized protein LOC132259538 [Phlebotomus argentipes]
MSLRDLFQEIKEERCQEVFLPKTNSVILKDIPEGNLDLQVVFPDAVDFVLQAKHKGITAVVTFKTPDEAAEVVKKKVNICGREILPRLLVDTSGKTVKPQKQSKVAKKKEEEEEKKKKTKVPIVFEKVDADGEIGKKIHLWKLTKNIKLQVKRNWETIKKEGKCEVKVERKVLFNKEISFMRSLMKFLENHKKNSLQESNNQFPNLDVVQKDELLWRLRQDLVSCVQTQLGVIQSAKMRDGDNKTEAKFAKEIHFLMQFRDILSTKISRKRVKKVRRETKGPK